MMVTCEKDKQTKNRFYSLIVEQLNSLIIFVPYYWKTRYSLHA